jgi:hypothetical protein
LAEVEFRLLTTFIHGILGAVGTDLRCRTLHSLEEVLAIWTKVHAFNVEKIRVRNPKVLWLNQGNVGKLLRHYRAQQPRREPISCSLLFFFLEGWWWDLELCEFTVNFVSQGWAGLDWGDP